MESTATPYGPLNLANDPCPSAKASEPDPASVVTTYVEVTAKASTLDILVTEYPKGRKWIFVEVLSVTIIRYHKSITIDSPMF